MKTTVVAMYFDTGSSAVQDGSELTLGWAGEGKKRGQEGRALPRKRWDVMMKVDEIFGLREVRFV